MKIKRDRLLVNKVEKETFAEAGHATATELKIQNFFRAPFLRFQNSDAPEQVFIN